MNKYDEGIIISKERYDKLVKFEEDSSGDTVTFDILMWHEVPTIYVDAVRHYFKDDHMIMAGAYSSENKVYINIRDAYSNVDEIKEALGELIDSKNKEHLNNLHRLEAKAKWVQETLKSENIKEMSLFQLIKWWFKNKKR